MTVRPTLVEDTLNPGTPYAPPRVAASPRSWLAVIFLLSLIVPINVPIGSVLLMPHRIVLLLAFFPALFWLVSGQAGRVIAADWLLGLSTIWSVIALSVVHGITDKFEAMGIHVVEFYGAYLLARVSIRSSADFRRVVFCLFGMLFVMLPFAAAESILKRNFLLEAIPGSISVVGAPFRWGMRRAQVLFTHPIHFGIFVSLGMGFFWYALRPRMRLIAAPMVIASTVFSLSSGALICMVVQMFLISWEIVTKPIRARWKIFAGIVAFVYVFLSIFSNSGPFLLLIRYAAFNTGSAYNRVLIWQYGTQNVRDNPVFGIGFNEWVRAPWMSTSADNYWLLLTMQFGLPMMILYIAGLLWLWLSIIRTQVVDPYDWRARAAYLTVVGGIIIGGGTVHLWTAMMAFAMFIFGSGVWIASGGVQAGTPQEASPDAQSEQGRVRGMVYSRFPPKNRANVPAVRPVPARSSAPFARSRKT